MIRILIVEDEKPISNLIRLSLTKAGYHCTCAYDGNAAVELLDQEIFDLILLDIMLPGANGFELMDYIRPLGIPVIFLTAVNSVVNRVRGLKMGAEDYIIKPFEIIELLAHSLSPKQIANELGISESTVRMHINVLKKRFNVSSCYHLMAVVTALGLCSPFPHGPRPQSIQVTTDDDLGLRIPKYPHPADE